MQFSSVVQSCPTLCDPMNCRTLGFPVHHQLQESSQTHVHWVSDTIQPSHPLSSPSPPALNLSQFQGLFKWVNSSGGQSVGVSASTSVRPMNTLNPSMVPHSPQNKSKPYLHALILFRFLADRGGQRIKKCVMCQEVESLKKYDNFRALQINLYYYYNRPWALMYTYPINKSLYLYCLKFIFSFISCLSSSL